MAQRDDCSDQMSWLRNRTNQNGRQPAYINEALHLTSTCGCRDGPTPSWTLKGDESGYKLTTWGGTSGGRDLSDSFTLGGLTGHHAAT